MNVSIKVYDILGREVATLINEEQKPASHEIEFEGSEITSGIYIYTLTAGTLAESRKMILIK